MRFLVALATLVLTLGAAGCGGYPSYPESNACGVPATLVEAVVGTDQFKTETKGDALPPTSSPQFSCAVNLEGQSMVLNVSARPRSTDKVAQAKQQIAASEEKFAVGEGQAGIKVDGKDFRAVWVCDTVDPDGTMTAYVDASDTHGGASARKALVTAVAEKASTACTA